MRKNKMMRLASALLILTLLTTCAISGTFAKYVTSDTASDTARVAKFGVDVSASGALFDKNYFNEENGNTPAGTESANLTVKSSNTDNLVAPGTKSSAEGLQFSVTGTPEVSVKVAFDLTINHEVFLNAPGETGAYKDFTNASDAGTFTFEDTYYPVKFTLKKGDTSLATGNLTEIQTKLSSLTSETYEAGTNLVDEIGAYTLTWEWAFEDNTSDAAKALQDQQDTLLGNLANNSNVAAYCANAAADPLVWDTMPEGNYNLNMDIALSITVTQVD